MHNYTWETKNNKLLLTFDDGPTKESTEKILLLLNDLNLKAVFFCVGNNVALNREVTNLIIDQGHTIGNHTYNHRKVMFLKPDGIMNEIRDTNNLLAEKHNYIVKYFRPPHGLPSFDLSGKLSLFNQRCVMWSLLTMDYKNDLEVVKFAVVNYLKQNSIVVLHDSKKSTGIILDSIKLIVDLAAGKGYEFGEPDECLN
jgi:peptidoglycan/xylan/chitin deacetylase (PgdA/CDA1 family)